MSWKNKVMSLKSRMGLSETATFESPSLKDALFQVWFKLAQWFWRRRFFLNSQYFRFSVIYSPYKMVGLFIWINLNFLHPRIGPLVLEKRTKNVKSLWQQLRRRRTTDTFRLEIFTWAFDSGELKRPNMFCFKTFCVSLDLANRESMRYRRWSERMIKQ